MMQQQRVPGTFIYMVITLSMQPALFTWTIKLLHTSKSAIYSTFIKRIGRESSSLIEPRIMHRNFILTAP